MTFVPFKIINEKLRYGLFTEAVMKPLGPLSSIYDMCTRYDVTQELNHIDLAEMSGDERVSNNFKVRKYYE